MIRKFLSALVFAATVAVWSVGALAQAPFSICQFSVTAAGVSNGSTAGVCAIDPQRFTYGSGAALLVNFSSGANATVSVQITGDQTVNVTGGGIWNNHDTLVSLTNSANGNLAFPVTGIRLNVTAYVSGTITLTVIQPALPKS